MRLAFALPALAVTTALTACAPVDADTDPLLDEDVPAARTIGEAESCIPRNRIRTSRVRTDRVIDFELTGGDIYRSVLPNRCPQLGFERAFTYNTSINQLCSSEIIYVLIDRGGGIDRGAGCGLGAFVPIEYVDEDQRI